MLIGKNFELVFVIALVVGHAAAHGARTTQTPRCSSFIFKHQDILDAAKLNIADVKDPGIIPIIGPVTANPSKYITEVRFRKLLSSCKFRDDGWSADVTCRAYSKEEGLDAAGNLLTVWSSDGETPASGTAPSVFPIKDPKGDPPTEYYETAIKFQIRAACISRHGGRDPSWVVNSVEFFSSIYYSSFAIKSVMVNGEPKPAHLFHFNQGKLQVVNKSRVWNDAGFEVEKRESLSLDQVSASEVDHAFAKFVFKKDTLSEFIANTPAGMPDLYAHVKFRNHAKTFDSVTALTMLADGGFWVTLPDLVIKDVSRAFLNKIGIRAVVQKGRYDYENPTRSIFTVVTPVIFQASLKETALECPTANCAGVKPFNTNTQWALYQTATPENPNKCAVVRGDRPQMLHERLNGLLLDPEFHLLPGNPRLKRLPPCKALHYIPDS